MGTIADMTLAHMQNAAIGVQNAQSQAQANLNGIQNADAAYQQNLQSAAQQGAQVANAIKQKKQENTSNAIIAQNNNIRSAVSSMQLTPDDVAAIRGATSAPAAGNAIVSASQTPPSTATPPPPSTSQVPVLNAGTAPPPVDAITSDQQAKTDIQPGDAPLDQFLSNLGSHQYQYIDKKHGDKTYVSPMAQELEKTLIGKSAVIDTPEGKKVQYARLMGASLSALALHHQDIKDIKSTVNSLSKAVKKLSKK
jgi:hypothetical protein